MASRAWPRSSIVRSRRTRTTTFSYRLHVRLGDAAPVVLDASLPTYTSAAVGAEVPVRYVRSWPFASDLGAAATVNYGVVAGWIMILGAMIAARYFIRRGYLAWYEKKVVDTLSGPLAENAKSTSM